jgi:hypothetical protein
MNVKIGAEAALFPEKEYINGIAVAVLAVFRLSKISPLVRFFMRKSPSDMACWIIAQMTRITSFSFLLVQLVGELEDDLLDLLHTVPVHVAGLFLQGLQCFP